MKKTLFYLIAFLLGFIGQAQTVLEYTYDQAGNQTVRKQKTSTDTPIEVFQTETDSKLLESLSEEKINNKFKVSPNPTSGFAELSWDPDISESITKIELVSLVSSERTNVSFSRKNTVGINLSRKATGLYVVLFHLDNEKVPVVQKKIVKF